jgi:hypothetical protein
MLSAYTTLGFNCLSWAYKKAVACAGVYVFVMFSLGFIVDNISTIDANTWDVDDKFFLAPFL